MYNVNVEALKATTARAHEEPGAVKQKVSFQGEWQTEPGQPQFRAEIPVPNGEPMIFVADFPPPMGGTGSAPNPLAYCFWGGMACYAMTFAQEAAKQDIALRALRASAEAEVDMSRALGASENPPVERIDWTLTVDSDASPAQLDELKRLADDHCPGVYCVRNSIELTTRLEPAP
ncbi:MAG: OsmC family protein [Thermoleophilaceae bacterium]